ncbi:MAG: inorganic phosphate transporter, partial [Candidatus Cloacimonadaceae bacterium]|nr:inorganic phosphate transporter [Candidatus Cloacimonadaceae bacterium]
VRMGIPVSTSQTIVGAIIGWNFFSGRITDYRSLLTIASSWVTAFVLSAVIAALLFYIFRGWINKSQTHLFEQDLYTRYSLVLVGAFGAYSLGANNIANVVGVFVPVTPFKDINIPGIMVIDGVRQLYILGAASIVVGIYTYSHKVMRTIGKDLFQLSPVTALVALMAEAIVLFLFASQGLYNLLLKLGLPTIPLVPVSSTQVIVGAVVGIAIAKGGKNLRYGILGRISLAWIAAPLMAFLFSYIALFIIQNVFEQTVHQQLSYTFNRQTVLQIERDGFDTNSLSLVNGRTFNRERELLIELTANESYTRQEAIGIIRITENFPLEVTVALLYDKGLHKRLDSDQLEDLKSLEERKFRHKWQLQQELQQFPSWKMHEIPENEAQKNHNRKIESKLELLYRTFFIPPAAK